MLLGEFRVFRQSSAIPARKPSSGLHLSEGRASQMMLSGAVRRITGLIELAGADQLQVLPQHPRCARSGIPLSLYRWLATEYPPSGLDHAP